MAKLPVLSARGVLKVLRRFGFVVVRQTGSHIHLWHDERRVLVTVPNHHELAKGTLIGIRNRRNLHVTSSWKNCEQTGAYAGHLAPSDSPPTSCETRDI